MQIDNPNHDVQIKENRARSKPPNKALVRNEPSPNGPQAMLDELVKLG